MDGQVQTCSCMRYSVHAVMTSEALGAHGTRPSHCNHWYPVSHNDHKGLSVLYHVHLVSSSQDVFRQALYPYIVDDDIRT